MYTPKGQSFVVNTQREFLFMERIVITGALGQIGTELVLKCKKFTEMTMY